METSGGALLAFGRLLLVFACMLILLRKKAALWQVIGVGSALLALLTWTPFERWSAAPLETLRSAEFLLMEIMIFGLLLLSGVQGAGGQNRRLVAALDGYLRRPRLRLITFPALVGLLPMPGGALFSCPMLEEAARGMNLDGRRKTLINYWFRHIWEPAWPLYPGYALVCALLNLPLHGLLLYTFPLVLFFLLTGWFFYLRGPEFRSVPSSSMRHANPADSVAHPAPLSVPGSPVSALDRAAPSRATVPDVLREAMPLLVILAGAALFSLLLPRLAPVLPAQAAFVAALACALACALFQARGRLEKPLGAIAFNRNTLNMLLLIYMVFLFKNIIGLSGIVEEMSRLGGNIALVYALFILLPLFCGMLTGVMVGYVGASFPILLGLLAESGLTAHSVPLIIMAVAAGNLGQMITPLHVCLAVTCEYFKTQYVDIWRDLLLPLLAQLSAVLAWCAVLYMLGATF